MKLTAIILLTACLTASAKTFSQVTLSEKNVSLPKVFKEIQKQTGYDFLFSYTLVENAGTVTVNLKNATLKDAVQEILRGKDLTFEILEKTVVVKPKVASSSLTSDVSPLTPLIDVHGRVVNENGEPVAGASIQVKGNKTKGTTTNENGEFTLSGVDENATLVISGVNIESFEVKVKGKNDLATLGAKTKVTSEQEVIVSKGYYQTTQKFNTGNVASLKSSDIQKQPVANPLAALEGRIPGLLVTQGNGVPGSSFTLQIRGINSIKQGSDPFIIIDGVPFVPQNTNLNQYKGSLINPGPSSTVGLSPLNSINPSDIESIDVLMDADATSIYGSRGSNGVILITTKKGKLNGKSRISGSIYTGISSVTRTMTMMNTQQYLQMRHEAFANDGITPTVTNAPDILVYDTTKYRDFRKEFIGGQAHTTDAYLSLSGGNGNTQYFVGSSYHHETTVFPGPLADNKVSLDANFNHTSTDKKLNVTFSTNYSYDQNNLSSSGLVTTAFVDSPNNPDFLDSLGNLVWQVNGRFFDNPLAYLKQKYLVKNYNLISHLGIGYQVLPSLLIKSSFGYNSYDANETFLNPASSQSPVNSTSSISYFGNNQFKGWIIEPQAEYKKQFSKSVLNVLAGTTFEQRLNNSTFVTARGFTNENLIGSISAASTVTASSTYSLYRYSAIFGRINYIYDGKYVINATGRRDGSSRFGPGKQFANFGSLAGAWIFSEENFLKEQKILNFGKVRLSYGTSGNDQIGDYQYLSAWGPTNGSSSLNYQGQGGLSSLNLFNPDYSWELNRKIEAAIDLGFLKNRIQLGMSWYRSKCSNQLVAYPLAIQTGFQTVLENLTATIQNTGIDILLNTQNFQSKNFNWNTSFIITIPRNKLLAFPQLATTSYATSYIVGKPITILNRYHFLGVDSTTGLFKVEDLNQDGVINSKDYQIVGDLSPKFYGGFKNSFSFKELQLDIFFDFRKQTGRNYLYSIYSPGGQLPGVRYNQPTAILNAWHKPGDASTIQRYTSSASSAVNTASTNFTLSDGAYSDASFIRLKTISLSYTLRNEWIGKLKMTDCKLYVQAQNLLTITNYLGNDPETQLFYSLPPLKTIAMGIQFTF